MPKSLLFLCCAVCILVLTIINLSIGPIINRKITSRTISVGSGIFSASTRGNGWGTYNCKYLSDAYDEYKKSNSVIDDEDKKYNWKFQINECKRKKAMYNMEYTAFIFNIVIGFVCCLLGLLHFLDVKKEFVPKTGLIGIGCGVVGFVLSLVYVIYNGIVYTNYYDGASIYKRNGDGAFAELDGGKYKCFYFDKKDNNHALIAKYSDLIKKQYNYNKDLEDLYDSGEINDCIGDPSYCVTDGYIPGTRYSNGNECKYLYLSRPNIYKTVSNKDKSDRFLTTLILSLLVCLADIGLALFGFLLFKSPE